MKNVTVESEVQVGGAPPRIVSWAKRLTAYREFGVVLALVVVCGFFAIISPTFRSAYNIQIIAIQMSTVVIVASGQTLVVISGAFDLSQSSVVGLVAMGVGIMWANDGVPAVLAIFLGLLGGAAAGAINGFLAARLKLHPIVMTLATSTIFLGLTYTISLGNPAIGLPKSLLYLGSGYFGPVPVPVVLMLVVTLFMQVLLTRTIFGLRVRQIGGHREAARLTGVNVSRIWLWVFVISGLSAALGGVVELGRVGAAVPTIGSTLLFPVITATIIGGTLLSGGEGSMVGTLLGAAILTSINDALVVLEVSIYWQDVLQGSLVVVALVIDQFRRGNLKLRDLIRVSD